MENDKNIEFSQADLFENQLCDSWINQLCSDETDRVITVLAELQKAISDGVCEFGELWHHAQQEFLMIEKNITINGVFLSCLDVVSYESILIDYINSKRNLSYAERKANANRLLKSFFEVFGISINESDIEFGNDMWTYVNKNAGLIKKFDGQFAKIQKSIIDEEVFLSAICNYYAFSSKTIPNSFQATITRTNAPNVYLNKALTLDSGFLKYEFCLTSDVHNLIDFTKKALSFFNDSYPILFDLFKKTEEVGIEAIFDEIVEVFKKFNIDNAVTQKDKTFKIVKKIE